jgi:effector-binding domain-containing protein
MMMDSWLGADFEKTLANLKKWSESQKDSESPTWNVEVIDFSAVEMMSTQVVCKPSEIGPKLGESYGAIGTAIGKQGLKPTGPVFAIYLSYSADSVVMQPAIPVEKQGKNEGAVTAGTLAATKAVRLDYYGDYPGTEQAHYFIDEWVKSKNMTIIGPPWEEYVTDPMAEKDTSKWLTRIYYPVQ